MTSTSWRGLGGGPFDLAYTRIFLMHEADTVRTLSQIARLLRPGGWVVAQEALRTPPPRSHPHLDALGAYWDLVDQCWNEPGACRSAPSMASLGLRVRRALTSLRLRKLGDYRSGAGLRPARGYLLAAKERAVASGIATGQQIDDLVSDLLPRRAPGLRVGLNAVLP